MRVKQWEYKKREYNHEINLAGKKITKQEKNVQFVVILGIKSVMVFPYLQTQ